MNYIKTNKGQLIKVNENYLKELLKYTWFIDANGYAVATPTIRSRREARESGLPRQLPLKMHRLVYELEYGIVLNREEHIDHINQDKTDNRIDNLRVSKLGTSINQINVGLRVDNTSGYKGVVYRERTNKWECKISYKGKRIWIGAYEDKDKAAIAYNEKALQLFGEASYLNKVNGGI
jgi:hypothetical protein